MAKKKARRRTSKRSIRRAEDGVALLHRDLIFLKDVVGATLDVGRVRGGGLHRLYRYLNSAHRIAKQGLSTLRIERASAKR